MLCLECGKECDGARSLGAHVGQNHMPMSEYKAKHGLLKLCVKCKVIITRKATGDYCNRCRDRSGANNPFYGKTHSEDTKNILVDKCRAATTKMWEDEEYRNKVISGTSKPRREEFKIEQSERVTKWYEDNPDQRGLRSIAMRKTWETGRIKPNSNSFNESKGEVALREDCTVLFPGQKVRKTTLRLDGKWYYPDIRIGKQHIVEYYGDYWHLNPETHAPGDFNKSGNSEYIWARDADRIKILESHGFNVLVIWQTEYAANREMVLDKILDWYQKTVDV